MRAMELTTNLNTDHEQEKGEKLEKEKKGKEKSIYLGYPAGIVV